MKIQKICLVVFALLLFGLGSILGTDAEVSAETTTDGYTYNIIDESFIEITKYSGTETKIKIPSEIDGKPVKMIGGSAFSGCSRLVDVTIPSSVVSIEDGGLNGYIDNPDSHPEGAFSGCHYLLRVTIPDSVTSIGYGAFYDCPNLTDITIPDSVISIGEWAFSHCSSLTTIAIPDSIASIDERVFYDCSNLTDITIPDSVTSIGEGAFSYCSSLIDITIPDSVTSIGEWAFSYCSSLTDITIPNSVTSIGADAFYKCSSLTNLTIASNFTITGYIYDVYSPLFRECDNLKKVLFLDGVTNICSDMFKYCDNLTTVIIPNSVASIGAGAFWGCSSLTDITIPGSVTSIDMNTFGECSSLTDITIPDSVTSIGAWAFVGCSSLTDITIPGSVTSIDKRAFSDCSSLTNITIPDSVTSIGDEIFAYCRHLSCVIIPDSITILGFDLFYECTEDGHTIDLYYIGTQSDWEEISNPYIEDTINVHFNSTFPTQIELDASAITLSIGSTKKLFASITPAEVTAQKIIWHSDNPDIVSCSNDGTITALSSGTATITAKTANGLTDTIDVTVVDQCGTQGHTEEIIPAVEATCTESGLTEGKRCSVCGTILTEQVTTPAFGHQWSEWSVTIPATDKANGEMARSCLICGTIETETLPKSDSTNPTVPPTATTPPATVSPTPTPTPNITPTPTKVKKLTAKSKKKNAVTLSWKKATDANGYEIQYAANKKFTKQKKSKVITKTKVTLKKLKRKKSYYFRVRAYRWDGTKKVFGKWSIVKKVKIKK